MPHRKAGYIGANNLKPEHENSLANWSRPYIAKDVLGLMFTQLEAMNERIDMLEACIHTWHRQNDTSKRLICIPGLGL